MIWPGGLYGCLAGCRQCDDTVHTVILNGIDGVIFCDKTCNIAKLPKRRTVLKLTPQNTLTKIRMVQYVPCRRRLNVMVSTEPLCSTSDSTETLPSFRFKGAA